MIGGVGQRVVQAMTVRQPLRDLQVPSGNGQGKSSVDSGMLRRPGELRQIQAGFGDNTQSSIAAAMDTLDITLQDSRKIVPSVEELMAAARAKRLEESKAATSEPVPAGSGDLTTQDNALPVDSLTLGQEQSQRTAPAEVRVPASYRADALTQKSKNIFETGLTGQTAMSATKTSLMRFDVKV